MVLPLLLAGAWLGLAVPDAVAAPTILLLHGGGWYSGSVSEMIPWHDDFRAHGYRTRLVDYPLGRVTRSIEYAEAVARDERLRGEPVIAYGMSAGGTIAAALAAEGLVDGAVDVIGPTDFTTWSTLTGVAIMILANMSEDEKRSASPYLRLTGRQGPQLLQCGTLDVITPVDQCVRYVAKAALGNSDTTLQTMFNSHSQSREDRDRARAWVMARWPATGPAASTSSTPRSLPGHPDALEHRRPGWCDTRCAARAGTRRAGRRRSSPRPQARGR
jgi:pimeloyl-ACP methyl ester carboxylesterase